MQNRSYGGLWNLIAEDRALRRTLAVIATLMTVIIGVTSMAVWPALVQLSGADSTYKDYARFLLIAGAVTAVIDLVISILLAWFDSSYSFVENLAAAYLPGFIILAICVFARPVSIAAVPKDAVSFNIVFGMFKFILALVLAFLPALVSAAAGWLVRTIYDIFFRYSDK